MTDTPSTPAVPVVPSAPAASPGTVLLRIIVLAAVGVGAATLANVVISRIGVVFTLPPELARLGIGQIPGADDQRRITAGNLLLQYEHAALWLGTAAALTGGLFGLTLGLFRRSASAIGRGVICGALLGGACGAAAGPLAIYLDHTVHANMPEGQLVVSDVHIMLMHGATWLTVGLGCGLGAGLGAAVKRRRTALAGMVVVGIASLLGGAVYPVVVAMTLPLSDPSLPVPEPGSGRLLWLALPAGLMGLALGRRG